MEHVFELNSVPLSVAHFNGDMRKICKSKLLQELEMDKILVPL